MRIAPGTLLVMIALTIPFLLQIPTVLHYLGIDAGIGLSVAVGVVVIGAILCWALVPIERFRTGAGDS